MLTYEEIPKRHVCGAHVYHSAAAVYTATCPYMHTKGLLDLARCRLPPISQNVLLHRSQVPTLCPMQDTMDVTDISDVERGSRRERGSSQSTRVLIWYRILVQQDTALYKCPVLARIVHFKICILLCSWEKGVGTTVCHDFECPFHAPSCNGVAR